jgi:hypothetical protein
MSNLITTTQDTYRNACIEAFVTSRSYLEGLAERSKEDRGQTAAEYMGVLLLIAAIITGIVALKPGDTIGKAINELVGKIKDIKI